LLPATTAQSYNRDVLGLPRDLGDGLVLRWGNTQDTDQLAEFNSLVHAKPGQPPHESVAIWTRDLMRGDHPTTNASDFTVVIDKHGKIISTLNLISQTWSYAGTSFGVGCPEVVGTDLKYRRQGLVRMQVELVHRRSALRGELMQGISGIPWYYRQFGYEMALNLGGSRKLLWSNSTTLEKDQAEMFKLRPATTADIAVLNDLYAIHCNSSLISRVRSYAEWEYELTAPHEKSIGQHRVFLIETLEGAVVGYIELAFSASVPNVREMAVLPGQNLRIVAEFLTRVLKDLASQQAQLENKEDFPTHCTFSLGVSHPIYTALGSQLEKQGNPYAWFIRIPDLPVFLKHITPALEKRLENSVMEHYTGILRLNFYRRHLTLVFEKGRLKEVGTYNPGYWDDGDAVFPDQTFLQLLLGYHSLEELQESHPDLHPRNARAAVLLDTLFPKRPSEVSPLN
jgi:hypothetical protein